MINDFMKTLYEGLHSRLTNKSEADIKKRAEALGITVSNIPNQQRFLFLICQHIAYFIDEHAQFGTRTDSIPFVFAVFLFHYIVEVNQPKIWKSVGFIKSMEKYFREKLQDQILEVFQPNQNLTSIPCERKFGCICNKTQQDFSKCQKCNQVFHPACQYQKLVCNMCYLTHYFLPIDWSFYNRFGQKYQTQTYFHGKFKTFNRSLSKKIQLTAMEFDINDFVDLRNAQQPQLWIKIMNFNDLSHSPQNQKWKNYTNRTSEYSMILNSNRFQFYMNFEPLRRKFLYFRNQNSLIFKLQNRLVNQKDNVLMIVCHNYSDFYQEEDYEIGVFRMTKIKQSKENDRLDIDNMMSNQSYIHDPKSYRLSLNQYELLNKYSQNPVQTLLKSPIIKPQKNNLKKQIMKIKQSESESQNEVKRKLNIERVRSYGCIHKEGIAYYEMKRHYEKMRLDARPVSKKPQKQKSFEQTIAEVKRQERQGPEKRTKSFKNKLQVLKKEQKKYGKFLKCPVCSNHIVSLYLLPYKFKEGEEMKNIHQGKRIKGPGFGNMKLDMKMFERKQPIFSIQKKQEEDDQSYSEQEQVDPQPSNSEFCAIIQSSEAENGSGFNKESQSVMFLSEQQRKFQMRDKFQAAEDQKELSEGEMTPNQRGYERSPLKEAAQRIFAFKSEVMSEESNGEECKEQRIEVQIDFDHDKYKIEEHIKNQVPVQVFREFTYQEAVRKENKQNQASNNQKMNKKIIEIFKANNQAQIFEKDPPVISLLSEDESEGQIGYTNY